MILQVARKSVNREIVPIRELQLVRAEIHKINLDNRKVVKKKWKLKLKILMMKSKIKLKVLMP